VIGVSRLLAAFDVDLELRALRRLGRPAVQVELVELVRERGSVTRALAPNSEIFIASVDSRQGLK